MTMLNSLMKRTQFDSCDDLIEARVERTPRMKFRRLALATTLSASIFSTAAPVAQAAYSTTPPTGDYAQAVIRIGNSAAGYCSGAMISPNWAITARHCIENKTYGTNFETISTIRIGDKPSQSRIYTGKTYLHPETDLALINLNTTYTGPTLSLINREVDENEILHGAGFGGTPKQATVYQASNTTYYTDKNQSPFYNGKRANHEIINDQFHVRGDSGSAVVTENNEIVSIVSNGSLTVPGGDANTTPFKDMSNPDVYYYRGWIMDTAGLSDTDPMQDSGPSDAHVTDFTNEISSAASSIKPEDFGVKTLSSDKPLAVPVTLSAIASAVALIAVIASRFLVRH